MPGRKTLPEKVRLGLWEQAGRRCELCRKEVVRLKEIERVRVMIDVWEGYPCWRCGAPNLLVVINNDDLLDRSWLARELVGEFARGRFPSFRKGFAKTSSGLSYVNHCARCGAVQGHMMPLQWLGGIGTDPSVTIECQVNLPRVTEDGVEEQMPFHVHHVDRNPSNNDEGNLLVLCTECHREIHRARRLPGNTSLLDFFSP